MADLPEARIRKPLFDPAFERIDGFDYLLRPQGGVQTQIVLPIISRFLRDDQRRVRLALLSLGLLLSLESCEVSELHGSRSVCLLFLLEKLLEKSLNVRFCAPWIFHRLVLDFDRAIQIAR